MSANLTASPIQGAAVGFSESAWPTSKTTESAAISIPIFRVVSPGSFFFLSVSAGSVMHPSLSEAFCFKEV